MEADDKKFWNMLHKRFEKATREFAEEFTKKVQEEYEETMKYYYNDKVFPTVNKLGVDAYTNVPRWYHRTYSLRQASTGYGKDLLSPENITPIENGYYAGITVDPRRIPNSTYKVGDSDWVFRRSFNKGIHGIAKQDVKNKGKLKQFTASIKYTSPYPRTWMNKSFKTITRKKYLRAMQDKIFSKYF